MKRLGYVLLFGTLLLTLAAARAEVRQQPTVPAAQPAAHGSATAVATQTAPAPAASHRPTAETAGRDTLRFGSDGSFRIMQLTDLHFTENEGQSGHVLGTIGRMVEWEHPDLILITGDLIYARNATKLLQRIGHFLSKTGIPYAITLGNHDAEQGLTRAEVYDVVRQLPGCINGAYNPAGERQGDFVLPIFAADGSCGARIYVMDSNDYNADDHSYAGVTAEQVAWYEARSAADAKRYGGSVPALLFLHIPLQEFAAAYDEAPSRAIGFRLERECPGRDNHGLFDALLRCGDVMGVFAGHDHANNYVVEREGIVLGYGRYSGGYAEYQELLSGARLFELKQRERRFVTWERLANGREARRTEFPRP